MNKYIKTFAIGATLIAMSSCLDEEPLFSPEGSENIIELADIGPIFTNPSGNNLPHAYANAFEILPEGGNLNVIVSYSGAADGAPNDITVELVINPTMVETYNAENGTAYQLLDESLYSLPASGLTLVIPKGQKTATLTVNLKTPDFDPVVFYALPLAISTASEGTVSGNFFEAFYIVSAKNQYDGLYRALEGSELSGHPSVSGPISVPNIELVTAGPNEVSFYSPFGSNGQFTGVANLIVVDEATNLVDLVELAGSAELVIEAATNNYNPDTRTFTLDYGWGTRVTHLEMTWDAVR